MAALRCLSGLLLGLALAGASYFGAVVALGGGMLPALIVGAIAGVLGGVYASLAFFRRVYGFGFFSILGFLLDMSWSLLNTVAALLVWLPACAIAGGRFVPPTSQSRRSGTFVYSRNPRGGGYAATTVGPVIAGGWNSHEETHVWQARLFGPAYLPVYGVSWLLNLLFRLMTGRVRNLAYEAYGRICFEDWAYWGGTSGAAVRWGGWFGGWFLALLYVGLGVLIPVGLVLGAPVVGLVGIGGVILYSLIRALTPRSAP